MQPEPSPRRDPAEQKHSEQPEDLELRGAIPPIPPEVELPPEEMNGPITDREAIVRSFPKVLALSDEDRLDDAAALALRALEAADRLCLPEDDLRASTRHNLGILYKQMGKYELAAQLFRDALGILPNDAPARSRLVTNVADMHFVLGDYQTARETYREALIAIRRIGESDRVDVVQTEFRLAITDLALGNVEQFELHFDTAQEHARAATLPADELMCVLIESAREIDRRGETPRASSLMEMTLELIPRSCIADEGDSQFLHYLETGRLHTEAGNFSQARERIATACRLALEHFEEYEMFSVEAKLETAKLEEAAGEPAASVAILRDLLSAAEGEPSVLPAEVEMLLAYRLAALHLEGFELLDIEGPLQRGFALLPAGASPERCHLRRPSVSSCSRSRRPCISRTESRARSYRKRTSREPVCTSRMSSMSPPSITRSGRSP
jgi:tetratricopeptide (TPR) repeat protein